MTLIHTVNIKLPSTHLASTEQPIHIFRAMHFAFFKTAVFVSLRDSEGPIQKQMAKKTFQCPGR